MSLYHTLREAVAGEEERAVLVVLGSGMSACFSDEEIQPVCPWPGRGVEGHPGLIARCELGGVPVLLGMGRRHPYEGYSPEEISELVALAGSLGLRRLLVTNAAGGLNPLLQKGDLVLHSGYLDALLGRFKSKASFKEERCKEVDGAWPVRSANPLLVDLYPAIREGGMERGIRLREGIYAGVLGPSYETRAEIRMLRRMGADLVGMSTITEVEAALRYGMSVVGFSLVTNVSSDTVRARLVHDEVTETSAFAAERVRGTIEVAVREMGRGE